VPHVEVETPLLPGSPVRIHYRESGRGLALLLLHSGWGFEAYPFYRQMEEFQASHRVIAPDRSGYGASPGLRDLPASYHRLYAVETIRLMDRLDIAKAALWGHSDGAAIAAWAAIEAPGRVCGLVLEAFHLWRAKVSSLPFFETGATAPDDFGERRTAALRRDHGEPRWREIVGAGARAWLQIIARGQREGGDLYDGRLGEIRCPILVLHGARDPRTEPGELEAIRQALPGAEISLLDSGHSPHSSTRMADESTRVVARFLDGLPAARRASDGYNPKVT